MPTESAFPTTQATWCETLLDARVAGATRARALEDMRVALMARYAGPLAVFVRRSSLSKLGEPAEIVNGFFASRLSDARFLEAWAASGMRLRRWLMNGILFYGQGLARDRARAAAQGGAVEPRELDRREGDGTTAEADFDRAWALAVVREATAHVEAGLEAEGRAVDFEIFRRHAIDGQPYAVFAREVGRSEQQCAGATRLVAQRVRAALADVLRGEGVAEHELDAEIARVRRVLWVRALRIRRIRQVESRLSMVRSTLQFDESRLRRFCAEKGIRRIRVYGSAVRPDFDAARSDIDLLIDFQPGKTPGFAFFALGEELAEILGRRVDVNTEQMLSRHFRDEVLSEAELLYDAA